MPKNPRGTIVFVHGCVHSGYNYFPQVRRQDAWCKQCCRQSCQGSIAASRAGAPFTKAAPSSPASTIISSCPQSKECNACRGLPEQLSHTLQALRRGYAGEQSRAVGAAAAAAAACPLLQPPLLLLQAACCGSAGGTTATPAASLSAANLSGANFSLFLLTPKNLQ